MKARKWICALLALVIILGIMGYVPVQAASHDDVKTETQTTQLVDSEIEINEQYAQQEAFMVAVEEEGLFRYLDETQFRNANHVARLVNEETLNTYVFQNADGTKSVYYMEADVKYIAEDGSICNKDISLVSVADGYTMRENNVQLLLPTDAENGICVSRFGYNVQLIPLGGEGTAVLNDNSIVYENYYGDGTALKYTPTLSGVKEDIILTEYAGTNSFQFILETAGLYLYENEGGYYLAETEITEAVFYLSQIVVYDAMGCPSAGTMTVETVTEGQAYLLTVSADVDFLTAPTTVYPVTIDPTITVKDTMAGGVIIDAPIFSGYPNTNFGGYLYNKIGYCDEAYGIGRVVVKLNGLLDNEMFQAMDPEYIERVEFYTMDDGSGYTNINLHPLTENSTWTESSITWNNVGAYGPVVDTQRMGHTNWTAFNITALVKQWKKGEQNGQCGFILIGTEEETKRMTLRSCEYGTGDYWPYVVVTYDLKLALNYYSRDILDNGSFRLIAYGENGQALSDVTWESSDPSVATVSSDGWVVGLRAGSTAIKATNADGYSPPCTVYVHIQDGVYRIKSQFSQYYLGINNPSNPNSNELRMQNIQFEGFDYLGQLWQVQYVGDQKYVISPLNRVFRYIYQRNGSVYAPYMTSLEKNDLRRVQGVSVLWNETGYEIRDYNNNAYALMPSINRLNSDIKSASSSVTVKQPRWDFELVPGLFLYTPAGTGIVPGSTIDINLGENQILAKTIVSGNGNLQTECVWYTNVEGINPIDMYTGMISAQQRAKTPVAVGASIGSQMYFFNFSVECKETIYVKNYYDSTIDDDILAKIDVAVAFLNTVYNEYCLYFEVDGPPTFYAEAGVEICGYGATRGCKEVSSNCGSDCSQHHKNVDRIAGELMEKWEPNHIVVMWSNVEHSGFYCYEDSLGNHATVGMTPALVSPFNVPGNEDYLPVVQILTIDDGEANEDMAVKLAHEVAHTLGLLEIRNDAYGDGISDHVYGGSAECIMGVIDSARIYDMLVGGQSAFCDYCKQKLHEEIDEVDLYEPREG